VTDNCPNWQQEYDVPHDVYVMLTSARQIHAAIETHQVLELTVEKFDLERSVQSPIARE
jgi:hypothetical protein